ncbi:MAG: ABC transporter permease [Bacteroidales bacterium]|nr:ABC transporter permease [Bacteroidales bacterium]
MFKIKQILKVLIKYKTSSWLTILSLVISFLGIITISLYVTFEKSYDQFHANAKSIYRLETREYGCNVPAMLSDEISKNTPEVEKLVVMTFDQGKISTPRLNESNISFWGIVLCATDQFFNVFTFPLTIGDQATALTVPNTVVLTESFSKKVFSGANPLGETIILNDNQFKVTGVMHDFPGNSSFNTDCIISFSTFLNNDTRGATLWSEWSFNLFVKLRAGSDPVKIAKKIQEIPGISDQVREMVSRHPGQPFILLQPLNKIHYANQGLYKFVNPLILNVFMLLAFILAAMGAVNFINFSTSQAPIRAKSLSVMRIMGGNRLSAMGQIIAESVLLSLIALMISLAIYSLIWPSVESIFGITGLSLDGRHLYLLWFLLSAILFGIFAGYYPARYVTSSPVAQSVKGNIRLEGKGKTFRNILITTQFTFTIALISSAFIIEKQLNYWRDFDIGINKEHVVYLDTTTELRKHFQTFADELLKNPDIVDYTYAQFIPGSVGMGWGREVDGQHIQIQCWPVDDRFMDFFGIEMADGRKFNKGSKADLNTFIINEEAVKEFRWDKPLEHSIPGFDFTGQVIGVSKNFNFSSLKEGIEPMQFWLTDTRKFTMMLRLKPGNFNKTMDYIKRTGEKFDPLNPIDVRFLDDSLNALYAKEERMGRFIEFGALWCILLAITGLLGLVIFICKDRTKEIGIRKVNGATIAEVLLMLNKDYIRWIVISFFIAVPIAWYGMNRWVQGFAYKTALSWWIFALAGLLSLFIAILTITVQSYRTASRNPVEALRYE